MVVMNCTVRRQLLNIDVPTIVSGSYDYINVVGSFSSEWDGMQKWIHIRNVENPTVMFDALFVNNEIGADTGLNLTAGQWDVWIHGASYVDNTLIKRLTTQVKLIRVEEGGSNELPDVPESVAEQIAAVADQALEVAQSVRNDADNGEFDGATFTPKVSKAGLLSWTNDKGLPNPQSVNIKGPKGDPGSGGGYEPPAGGIPASDLSADVQSSLAKANSALQEVPSTYRTASAQNEIDSAQNEKINPLYNPLSLEGSQISFTAQAAVIPDKFTINVFPAQSGSGTPSPTNPRALSSRNEVSITHNGDTINIPLLSAAPTYGGELDLLTGIYTDFGTVVNFSDLTWTWGETYALFSAQLPGRILQSNEQFAFCSNYEYIGAGDIAWIAANIQENQIALQSTSSRLRIKDTRFTTVEDFLAANANTQLVYRKTPTVYKLPTPNILPISGANSYTTTSGSFSAIVNAYLNALTNAVKKATPLSIIADSEASIVSRAYSVNDFLIYNNKLCKVTAPIQSGGTITIGVNAVVTTIMAEITALLNS